MLVPVFKLTLEVLPPEVPGNCVFWTEYLSVDGGEFGPFVIEPVGIEGVSEPSGPPVVIIPKWIKSASSGKGAMESLGEEAEHLGVSVQGV